MRVFASKQNQPEAQTSSNLASYGIKPLAAPLQRTVNNEEEQKPLHADSSKESSNNIATPRFNHNFSRIPVHTKSPFILQKKCACGSSCAKCQNDKQPDERLQKKHSQANQTAQTTAPPVVNEVLQSSGQPLDASTQEFMESRFDHDFSQVRVHTDSKAAGSAKSINALAYTVGNNIVFGAGQYSSGTTAGRRLLAHELTHVIQQEQLGVATIPQHKLEVAPSNAPAEQEADSIANDVIDGKSSGTIHPEHRNIQREMIQRTPVAPDYKGVTGVLDLDKLRIDPVPDLALSTFTSPLDVKPHVLDPAIKHITWMLYDPNDSMVTGYSTLPGNAKSTTLPFTLKPSFFSGAGFVEGKYILRLSGLNDQHQPIVYADRDITVVKSDLTTGTALATTYGKLTFTKYDKEDATPPSKSWKVNVELQFLPDSKVSCDDAAFLQAAQTVEDTGKPLFSSSGAEIDARKTPIAWSIDRVDLAPTPFYGGKKDGGGTITIPPGKGKTGKGGATPSEAILKDAPGWNKVSHDKFESCVVCRNGANIGQVYGCATWGYTADAAGKVTMEPRSFRQNPSDQFKDAHGSWNTWRATVDAAKRPEEAPALKKP